MWSSHAVFTTHLVIGGVLTVVVSAWLGISTSISVIIVSVLLVSLAAEVLPIYYMWRAARRGGSDEAAEM